MGSRRSRARRRRAIRIALGTAFVVVLLLLLAAAAAYQDLRQIRDSLTSARVALAAAVNDPASLRTHEGRQAAVIHLDEGVTDAESARVRLHDSKLLGVARFVPVLRRQRNGVAAMVYDTVAASKAGRRLVGRADSLAAASRLQDGTVPLGAVRQLASETTRAGNTLTQLDRGASGLWGPLASGRRAFDDVAGPTGARLRGAGDSLNAAVTFMGSEGARRYFVAVENNDEMRDRGMVLSYAVATFDHGHLQVERHGSVNDLTLRAPVAVPLDPGRAAIFGSLQPTQLWESVNAPADFPWSARTMAAMYKQASGQAVDGVIAIDVPGLAHALRATGPVQVAAAGSPITADNANEVLLKQLYDRDPSGSQRTRHEILDQVAVAIISRLTTSSQDAVSLGRELGEAAAEGRFRLWSSNPDEERVFERTGLGGGALSRHADRTFHVSVQNGTATKLDYYVDVALKVDITLTRGGSAVVRTQAVLTNSAPKKAGPSYQLGPDPYGTAKVPGEYKGRLYFYSPAGSVALDSVPESGLVLHTDAVDLLPGATAVVNTEAVIPNAVRSGQLVLRFVPQSRLRPMVLDLRIHGRGLSGPARVQQPLTQTTTLSWRRR